MQCKCVHMECRCDADQSNILIIHLRVFEYDLVGKDDHRKPCKPCNHQPKFRFWWWSRCCVHCKTSRHWCTAWLMRADWHCYGAAHVTFNHVIVVVIHDTKVHYTKPDMIINNEARPGGLFMMSHFMSGKYDFSQVHVDELECLEMRVLYFCSHARIVLWHKSTIHAPCCLQLTAQRFF